MNRRAFTPGTGVRVLRKLSLKAAPRLGTVAPRMGTARSTVRIGETLFGKTQRALLALFFVRPEQSFYLRQIVRTAGLGQGTVQRELARWVAAGLLLRARRGNQVYYHANAESPVFAELKALTVKTTGVADVVREALAELANQITVAFVHGSVAAGTEQADSDVDVVVVGPVTFSAVATALQSAQEMLGREVNPTVYSAQEFRQKLRAGHHFLTAVAAKSKIFLMGDERELKRLGA